MLLEGLKEFSKDLLFCLPAINNWGMFLRIVDLSNLFNVDNSTSVKVELLEGSFDHSESEGRQFSSDGPQELIILNGTVSVWVKRLKERSNILLRDVNFEISASLFEFHPVEGFAAIIVHDFEYSLQSNNSSCSSLNDLLPEGVDE